MAFWDDWLQWWSLQLAPYMRIPYSTLMVLGMTVALTLASLLVYRLTTDVHELKRMDVEVRRYTHESMEAKKKDDKVAQARLKKQEARIKNYQTYSMRQRSKVSLITMIPFTMIYFFLSSLFSTAGVVAYNPFPLPFFGSQMYFFQWYLVAYFTVYTVLSRLFGITFEMSFGKSQPGTDDDKPAGDEVETKPPSRSKRRRKAQT